MQTDALGKLFGSVARVRLLRLFLFNPTKSYTLSEAAARSRTSPRETRREAALLCAAKAVKRTSGKPPRFSVNRKFEYISALQNLLINAPLRESDLASRFKKAGVKLIVLAGIFAGDWDGRIDLLIVGDNKMNSRKLRATVRALEADLGKELRYATMPVEDFRYRMDVSDRLVRDVFDYPHRIAYDKLDMGLK